jgi:translation initiation factor IF-3
MPYEERTKEERKNEILNLVKQLNNLRFDIKFPAIKELYKKFNEFINEGEVIKINIEFPEVGKKIKGELAVSKAKDVYIKFVEL